MRRGIIVVLLIILASLLIIFEMPDRNAQATGEFSEVLHNQQLILEKLKAMEGKLGEIENKINVIKMWVKP